MRVRNIHRNIYSRNSEFENLKISIYQHKNSLKIPKGNPYIEEEQKTQ